MNKVDVSDSKKVFAVSINSDLTEGRGYQYVAHFCQKESTAIRLSKRASVQGCDGDVGCVDALKIGDLWYVPNVPLVGPSREDDAMAVKMEAVRVAKEKRDRAIDRARELGLTDAEIADLKSEAV